MFGRKQSNTPSREELIALLNSVAPSQRDQTIRDGDDLKERLTVAAQHTGAMSPPRTVEVVALGDPHSCRGQQEEFGLCFEFQGTRGQFGKVYFFPEYASIWPNGEAGPRGKIHTDMINVRGYQGALMQMIDQVPKPRAF